MNRNIQEMNWNENVSQAWALVTTKHPHGIILRDDSNKFAGFLSNHDLMAAKHNLDELALTGE
jgi:CBS-domain-containing membrane protein